MLALTEANPSESQNNIAQTQTAKILYDKIQISQNELKLENKNRIAFCSDGTNSVASNLNGVAGLVCIA